jgi:hypothetical protein
MLAEKLRAESGLPDGIFSNQESQFGQILEGLGMKKVDKFNGHLEYITAIRYILRQFCNLCSGNLVYFLRFGILC